MGSELLQELVRYSPIGKALPLVFLAGRKRIFLALSVLPLRKNEDVHQRPSCCFTVQLPVLLAAGDEGSLPACCGVVCIGFKDCSNLYLLRACSGCACSGRPGQSSNCLCRSQPQGSKAAVAKVPGTAKALVLLCCSWGRDWAAWGCRTAVPAAPRERVSWGLWEEWSSQQLQLLPPSFTSSVVDGTAGCWSSRALALIVPCWFIQQVCAHGNFLSQPFPQGHLY